MNGFRFRLARFTLNYRWLVMSIAGAMTLFFIIGLKNVEIRTIFSDLLPKDHPFVQVFKDHPNFGNPLTVTIMVQRKDGTIYNVETLQKVWDMTRDADLTPGVDHDQILSISTEKARYAEATPEGINTQPLMGDHAPTNAAEIAQFVRNVQMSPNARRFLISDDGSATLIRVTFIERLLDYGVAFEQLQALVEKNRDAHHNVYMAGQPALTGWVYRYESQMLGIFAVTVMALILSLIFYMRNVAGVVAPLVASLIAAIWGFGFVGWLRLPIEPLIMVVPLLLTARSFSHSVQYIERYYELLHSLGDKKKAAEVALSVMMAPSVLGIVTDASGLFLIAISPIPTMERFAIFCGFWATILIPANVFLTPLILTLLPEPKNVASIVGTGKEASASHRFIARLLRLIAKLSYGRTAWITTFVVVVSVGVAFEMASRIKIGNPVEGSSLLWDYSEYNHSVAQINKNFPGLNTLEIVFEAKDPHNPVRVARQAETVATMYKLQYLMERGKNPPVATLSFADYLPEANRLFSGGDPRWAPLDPNDRSTAAAAGALLFGTSPKAFSHVSDFEMQNSVVSLWYKDNKQETVDGALASARAALEKTGTDFKAFRIRLGTGTIALQQSINDTVSKYHELILLLLNVVIFIVCSYAYKSFVAAIILLIPVNMSNLFLNAAMVAQGMGLDVNTLPILAIGLGVGIDYGIYLLSRIYEEFQTHKRHDQAIVLAIATTGKAIFFTAIIILIGVLPWYFLSDLRFLADMGLLLVLVMLINMVCALVVVPLLVWLIKPKFLYRNDIALGESVDLSEFLGVEKSGLPQGAE